MYSLKKSVAPDTEPVTIATLKQHLRIPASVITEDTLLAMYITTARTLLEEWTQRQFQPATFVLYLDEWQHFHHLQTYGLISQYYPVAWQFDHRYWWQKPMQIPKPPLTSVSAIQYYDQTDTLQTLATNQYVVDANREPGRILFLSFPSLDSQTIPRIQITFTAGYAINNGVPTLPMPLQHGIMLLAADMYKNREATTETNLKPVPTGLKGLIDIYRIQELGEYGL